MLVLSDSDEEALLRARRQLYAAGMMSITLTYTDLLSVIFDETVCALMLTNPYDSTIPDNMMFALRKRNPGLPIIVFKQTLKNDVPIIAQADIVVDISLPNSRLIDEILLSLSKFHKRDVALFQLGCARDHLLDDDPAYGGVPIHMTPIERNIYRHLMVAAYHPVSAKELQRYCTKPGTCPTLGNIASHIYRINLKAQEALGHHIILSDSGGYRLITSEELMPDSF